MGEDFFANALYIIAVPIQNVGALGANEIAAVLVKGLRKLDFAGYCVTKGACHKQHYNIL